MPAAVDRQPARTPRRSLAVLGFRNLTGRSDAAWLSTALSEMLTTELATGEALRLVPGEDVARAKLELDLADADSLARDSLARIRSSLGSDLVVVGSYLALGPASGGRLRLDVRLQDANGGDTQAVLAETGTESELFDLVTRAGARLRAKLGVAERSEEAASTLRASLPASSEAARRYAEGLSRLRLFDARAAKDLLIQAAALEPQNAMVHTALSDAWLALGYEAAAGDEAQRAFELAGPLSREEKLWIEGRYRARTHEWERAIQVLRTLCEFFPDNLDYALHLARVLVSAGRAGEALPLVEAMRKLPAPAREDPRIDLAEAEAAEALSDFARAQAAAARTVEKARSVGARLILARALVAQGWALNRLGDPLRAVALYQEARRLYEQLGDRPRVAEALSHLANLRSEQGDVDAALGLFDEAARAHRQVGNRGGLAGALNNIAVGLWERGDLDAASKRYQEALALFREIDDKAGAVTAQGNLGLVLKDRGDLAGARTVLEESLPVIRTIRNRAGLAVAQFGLGGVLLAQGEIGAARRSYQESLAIARGMDQRFVAYDLHALGELLLAEGDLPAARRSLEESLAIRTRLGAKLLLAETRLALAGLAIEEGQPAAAATSALEAARDFQAGKAAEKEGLAHAVQARALLAQGRPTEAARAIATAVALTGRSQNREAVLSVAIVEGRVETAQGRHTEAAKRLAAALAEADSLGLAGIGFEARFALAEAEMASGQTAQGRERLRTLAEDARARGFGLVARKAAALAGGA